MQDNPRLGITLMIATTIVFAAQDGLSRYLAENYNVITVVTIRYIFFMCFVLAFSANQQGAIRAVANTTQLPPQIGREWYSLPRYVLLSPALPWLVWFIFMRYLPAIR